MKTGSIIKGIIIAISAIVIISVVFTFNQESHITEVEDTLDREIRPTEIPEIQQKLDEIKQTADESEYKNLEREWITSGKFQLDRSEYAIGESVFIRMGGLNENEKGQIAIMRPLNSTHYTVYLTIPFDGTDKPSSNTYFTPQISKFRGICSTDNLTGEWVAVFRGTDYPNIDFKINEKVIPGTNIESVC